MMTSLLSRKTRSITIALSLAYACFFILMLLVHPGSDRFYTDFNNLYQILAPLFAACCGITYACYGSHDSRTSRIAWLLIGLGALSFALGQSTWTLHETVLRREDLPSPGPADIGYLGAYPFLIAGVILLFGSTHIASRARLLVDSALAASSVAVLSWFFLVSELWKNPGVSMLGKVISVAYPLGDVAVLLCAIALIKAPSTNPTLRRSSVFLAGGIVLLAFADTLYTYYNLHNSYETGSWFDWGWSFGWLLIGYASLLPQWWPQPNAQESLEMISSPSVEGLRWVPFLAPYLAVGSAFALVVLYNVHKSDHFPLSVVFAGLVLITLVVLRQILTLAENQYLTAELRMLNINLEKSIVRRTEQLSALLYLTKAINTTLRVDKVIAATLETTRRALQADAVVIRLLEDGAIDRAALSPVHHIGLENHPEILKFIEYVPASDKAQVISLPANAQDSPRQQGMYLSVPLRWQQHLIGMLGVIRWNAACTPSDAEMLESIGVEVGTALENARLYASAVQAADRDSVTGLYNHRAIQQHLAMEFAQASKQNSPLSVMIMDLDNFKRFNDTYGHPVGDQVLKHVASVLQSQCRSTDILGRYGGDEFIVILPGTDAITAYRIAVRLRDAMARAGFRRSSDPHTIPITLSFGLATYPTDSDNRHELLMMADANLFAAKQSGEGIRGTSKHQRTNRELRAEYTFEALDVLVTAVDNKDRYTRRHSEDVTEYALWVGEEIGLSEETQRIIRIGCLLHDVGKIGVPDDILRKPGRLTAEEFEIMKRHPRIGVLIVGALGTLPNLDSILEIVRSHHERWDGRGYPDGLAGEHIPLLGRLVAIADAFSAMTTDRPYRKGLDWTAALKEIYANSGTQFDPTLARFFIRAVWKRMRNAMAPTLTVDTASTGQRIAAQESRYKADDHQGDHSLPTDMSAALSSS